MNVRPKYKVENAYKLIRLRPQNVEAAKQISDVYKVSLTAASVLSARGFKADDELKHYIQPSLREGLPDPSKLKNLDKACELIAKTIESSGAIAICCDFDVDGLSGGAQVHHFLSSVGAKSRVFVPDRFEEGYGLNENMIRQIAQEKFALVITVDYGTTNAKELAVAKELGLKTIVIDHHHVGEHKPPCDVFINPNQKGCGFADRILCAAGLAWYLIVALKKRLPAAKDIDSKTYLDLACLGTICDMVPLRGANRIIAKRGLELLSKTERVGLVALKNAIGFYKALTCTDVSFGIGPRLNAAGRMVHGDVVIELLTTSSSDKAKKIAQKLNKLNLERQDTENLVKDQAIKMLRSKEKLPFGIVVYDKSFHTGVIGIVAQRLVENFYRPSIVLGRDSQGIFKGSVRGIKGFNVVESLAAISEHLIKFGGHEGAGGLSVEEAQIEKLVEAFDCECAARLAHLETDPYVEADAEVNLAAVDFKLVDELKKFAPFGMGNPNPVLLVRNLKIFEVKIVKEAHLKIVLTDGKIYLPAFFWRLNQHPDVQVGATVDVAFRPEINTFNGNSEIQANLQAIVAA